MNRKAVFKSGDRLWLHIPEEMPKVSQGTVSGFRCGCVEFEGFWLPGYFITWFYLGGGYGEKGAVPWIGVKRRWQLPIARVWEWFRSRLINVPFYWWKWRNRNRI